MNQEKSGGMLWFLAGVALGAAAAMLVAPRSGAEVRDYLRSRAEGAKEFVSGTGMEYFERGRDLYERGRHLADEAAEMFDEGRRLVEGEEV